MVRSIALAPFAFAIALSSTASAQQPRRTLQQTVLVHLDGDDDAALQVKVNDEWVTYCDAPCNERVGADAIFRVSGSGLRNSPPFMLHGEPGSSQTVSVDSASSGEFVFGASLVVVGSLGVLTGVALDFVGVKTEECTNDLLIEPDGSDSPSSCDKPWHNLVGIGVGIGIASLVVVAGGAALMLANRHSTVSQSASRSRPSLAVLGFGASRQSKSTWLMPKTDALRSLVPIAATTPILSISF